MNNQENVFTKVIDNKYVDSFSIKIKGHNKLDQYRKECEELGIDFEQYIYKPLISCWKELFPIEKIDNNSPFQMQALDYLVYKTLRVGFQYENFSWSDFISTNQDAAVLLNMIELFRDDNSHMTLKLKQTLSFLMNNHIEESENITVADLSEKVDTQVQTIKQFLEEYKEKKKKDNPHGYTQPGYVFNEIDCLPPPIFDTELFLNTEGGNDKRYSFNMLSSGEKQMIYTISSILYHINNINSVHKGSRYSHNTTYEHINVILEEVELYYHPEMQRKLIKYLIDQIKALKADYIKSLQIMLVTHSPFVLSDIPINNVLFLENGSSSHKMREKHNTFSANIYDLFHESFFLEAPMGEFAANVIKRLFDDIENNKVNEENTSTYESIIKQIGDEFVRFELKRQLYDKMYNKTEAKIKFLKEQLRTLEEGGKNA